MLLLLLQTMYFQSVYARIEDKGAKGPAPVAVANLAAQEAFADGKPGGEAAPYMPHLSLGACVSVLPFALCCCCCCLSRASLALQCMGITSGA